MPEFMISGIATKIINVDDVACGALEGKPFPEKGFEYWVAPYVQEVLRKL